MTDRSLYTLLLAGLFHDPPWKPWVVIGKRSAPSIGELENRLKDRLHKEYYTFKSKTGREHEKHALILPLSIAKELVKSGCEVLRHTAQLFVDAARQIVEKRNELREADVTASAIDRHLLYEILEDVGKKNGRPNLHREVYSRSLRLVNPFTLQQLNVPGTIETGKIVKFVDRYVSLLVDALKSICCSEKDQVDERDCWALAVTVAYLLLEPVWYYTTSEIGPGYRKIYAPPADTRVPTHTVFDHANTLLSVILLRRHGCLAVVDLAGVQAWISESRRLRDLWAASWLASLLAWKAVESFVKKYGPGVLVSPPGRLNPFLASSVLGEWLEKRDKDWLWKALGLNPKKKWPVDPVVPSRLIIALPGDACENLEDKVSRNIKNAWRLILEKTLNRLENDCKKIKDCRLDTEALKKARNLEPPLGARVIAVEFPINADPLTVYHGLLVEIAKKEAEARISASGRRTGRAYHEYAVTAYTNKSSIGDTPKLCTVCGRGIALLEARDKRIRTSRNLVVEAQGDDLCPYCLVKRTLRYILSHDDNQSKDKLSRKIVGLALQKGLVTWRSVSDHSTRYQFLRIMIDEGQLDSVLDKIGDLVRRRGKDIESDLVEILGSLNTPPGEDAPKRLRSAVKEALGTEASGDNVSSIANLLWRILTESSTSRDYLKKRCEDLSEEAKSVVDELQPIVEAVYDAVKNIPNRYAFIMSDGDYMGKGLLSGRIPIARVEGDRWISEANDPQAPARACNYFQEGKAFARVEVDDATVQRLVQEAYTELCKRVEKKTRELHQMANIGSSEDPVGSKPPTLPVTPAYHATVSRSLAVVSALDRETIEVLEGDVVYLGGDDALVVAPPETLKNRQRVYPALEIAAALREHMSGSASPVGEGFIAMTYEDGKSTKRILHLAPAPGAYGRSTVIYLGDVKRPMWLSLASARSLEEVKDGSRTIQASKPNCVLWRKDLLVVASETRGAIVVPINYIALKICKMLERRALRYPFSAIIEVLSAVSNKEVSSRLLYITAETLRLIFGSLELARENGGAPLNAAAKILASEIEERMERSQASKYHCKDKIPAHLCFLAMLAPCNNQNSQISSEEDALSIAAQTLDLSMVVLVDKLTAAGVNYSRNPYISFLPREEGEAMIPLLLAIMGAAYVYSSATSPPR